MTVLAAAPAHGLIVELSDRAVTIRGATPGASVILLSVAREPSYHMWRVVNRRDVLADADRDGTIRHEPERGVSFSSLWVAVDMISGKSAVAAPIDGSPREMRSRGVGRGRALEAIGGTVDVDRGAVELMVVRPGTGAWWIGARDGSASDRDGHANGRLRLDLSKLQPLGATAGNAPHALQKGDVVAVIDDETMEYALTTIEEVH